MRAEASGFSLLEVLVALAVLALAMAALIRTAGLQGAGLVDARQRTCAQWVAANVIADARLAGAVPAEGTRDGEMEMGRVRWRWRLTVAPTPVPGVRRLAVEVDHPQGRRVLTLDGFSEAP